MSTEGDSKSEHLSEKVDIGHNIHNCDEKEFIDRADEFTRLCRLSFAEHANRNVKMGPCYMITEKWIALSKGCIGQYIEDQGRIIAFWIAHPDYAKKETYGRILAVDPEHKGKHLGLSLSLSRANYLREQGMNVFMTDTSLKAPHVVKFHKNYGCKAVGMTSWPNTNYYTVILRLALTPEYEISDKEARRRFFISKIKCKMLLKEDGSVTLFGRLAHPALSLLSKLKHQIIRYKG